MDVPPSGSKYSWRLIGPRDGALAHIDGSAAAELSKVAAGGNASYPRQVQPQEFGMITLAIRNTLDANKLAEFDAYVRGKSMACTVLR